MYNLYFFIIITIFFLSFIWGQVLSYLNRKRMSPLIPKELEGIYNSKEYAKQQDYQKTNSRFGLFSGGFSFVVVSFVLGFGFNKSTRKLFVVDCLKGILPVMKFFYSEWIVPLFNKQTVSEQSVIFSK